MIPYRWSSSSNPQQVQAVKLYLSQDQGKSWQELSTAKPEVRFFTYHAPGDGEYWFSIRTFDIHGRGFPEGPHRPELRILVDTTSPRVTSCLTHWEESGYITARWEATDPHLDRSSAKLQYRTAQAMEWQEVVEMTLRQPAEGRLVGEATWQVPEDTSMVWVRLSVRDLAGNGRQAGAEARRSETPTPTPTLPPTLASQDAGRDPVVARQSSPPAGLIQGVGGIEPRWTSLASLPSSFPSESPSIGAPTSEGPRLWPTADLNPSQNQNRPPADGLEGIPGTPKEQVVRRLPPPLPRAATAPPVGGSPFQLPHTLRQSSEASLSSNTTSASRSGPLPPPPFSGFANALYPETPYPKPNLHELSRELSAGENRLASARPAVTQPTVTQPTVTQPTVTEPLPNRPPSEPVTSGQADQHLNQHQFEIGYDVDLAGALGITRVELWGTADNGRSWQRLAVDHDNRSPIQASVPGDGLYGFKIVIETAGGLPPIRPRPGDQPERTIRFDTLPPIAKLTGIRHGTGYNAGHLIVRWLVPESLDATDRQMPNESVALSYSSHAEGPWVTAVTNLPHNGEYLWRLARHLPRQIYLRLEVRDQAGNIATDQTQVPVPIAVSSPVGRLQAASPANGKANTNADWGLRNAE